MNPVVTRASIVIAICLSSSLLGSKPSSAVSLKIGEHSDYTVSLQRENSKETLTLNKTGIFPTEIFTTFDNLESDFSITPDNKVNSDNTFTYDQKLSRLFLLDDKQSSSLYSPKKDIVFTDTSLDNTIQDSNRTEDVRLLNYFTEALSNIEIQLTRNNSSADSEIIVLSQTSYQDIYEDVYTYEVDLSASNSSSASNSTPQESDGEDSSNFVFFRYSPYISNLSNYNSSVSSSSLFGGGNNLPIINFGEDLSSQINSLLLKPTNIFTNVQEINNQSRFNYKRNNGVKKDPKMVEIERKLEKEREKRRRQNEKMREKLERERQKRAEKRRRRQEQLRRKRQERLRKQRRQQQEQMRKQQDSFR